MLPLEMHLPAVQPHQTVPKGFRRVAAEVWVNDGEDRRIVVLADPDEVWPDEPECHNCDAMGCQRSHVVHTAEVRRG